MSEIFSSFSLHAAKFHGQVWLCLGGIWAMVLFCTISSINAQPWAARQRKGWILMVCLLPIIGTLIYLPFSCHWQELVQQLFMWPTAKAKSASRKTGKPEPLPPKFPGL